MPQVSVIVPVHNGQAHLRETLGSIASQTLTDLEIIVVNDASTDASADIIAEFMATDPRISCADGPGVGSAGAARNVGLALATGDYLAVLDSDDFFAPTLLEKLYTQARADDADLVATKFRTVNQDTGEVTLADWALRLPDLPAERPFSAQDMGDHLFIAMNPAAWNKLFRTAFVREAGLHFQSLKRADDLYFTYMALALAQRISTVEGYLIDYRVGNANSLEGSLHESPLDFVRALELLQDGLREAGLLERCERAFANVAAEVCLSNLSKVSTAAAFVEVLGALQTRVYEQFGVAGRPAEYFLRKYLAVQVEATMTSTSEELLFSRLQRAEAATNRAQAQARDGLAEINLRANASRLSAALAPPPEPVPAVDSVSTESVPDVSVVIPVHNTAEYLERCITSVLGQTGVGVEVVCVDDGSTDLSGEVLDQLAGTNPRITIIHQENAGQSVARNRAVDLARGRYVCFVDSDDWWQEDSLADLVAQADRDRLDLLLFDATTVREPGVTDSTWALFHNYYVRSAYPGVRSGAELLAAMHARAQYLASPCLYLIRSDHLRQVGVRFYPGIVHEDNLFTFELMLSAGRAAHSRARLYCRRLRPGSTMTAGSSLASAQGYLINYLEMVRKAGRSQHPEPLATAIAAIIFSNLKGVHNSLGQLSAANADRLKEVDPSPEAQAAVMLLKHWRYLQRPKGAATRSASKEASEGADAAKPAESIEVPRAPRPAEPQEPIPLRRRIVRRLPRGLVRRLRWMKRRFAG